MPNAITSKLKLRNIQNAISDLAPEITGPWGDLWYALFGSTSEVFLYSEEIVEYPDFVYETGEAASKTAYYNYAKDFLSKLNFIYISP